MPTMKLTKRAIERLPAPHPSGKQQLVWDTELKGFGVLVSGATTAKTYVVQHKLKDGRTRRVTVAPVNAIDLDGEDGARARARKVIGEIYAGTDPKAERRRAAQRAVTLRATLDAYLGARKDLAEKSRKEYRTSIERHLIDWLDLPIRDITPEMVEKRHSDIAAQVKKRAAAAVKRTKRGDWRGGGPTNGASTANGVMRAFRALYNFAAERNPEMVANPVKRLRRAWFAVPRRERMVRPDQLPAFYAAVDALPSRTAVDYIKLLLFTGLRRNEAAALLWEEIDFAERVIRLPAKRTKARRKLDLPMSDFVRNMLVARRALGRDGPFVFPADSRSGHLTEPKFPLAQVARDTGITISAHDLRRTFVTVAEGTDISPLALKALVNHSLGNDVTSGYVIATVDRLREPAQRVADRLKALCGIAPAEGVARLGERA
jgi:integrase